MSTINKTVFCINEAFWTEHGSKMLSSKMEFERYLAIIIGDFNENDHAIIFLPHNVNIAQRHRVHTFSKKNEIKGTSSNIGKKRLMKLVLEPDYIKQILN